ncbi:MAG TPA: hypothetical protein DDZ51_17895 [Planctomycetaceae bacterium]|nr:hypothetical protein [Planctomycetaceae bacterium]
MHPVNGDDLVDISKQLMLGGTKPEFIVGNSVSSQLNIAPANAIDYLSANNNARIVKWVS